MGRGYPPLRKCPLAPRSSPAPTAAQWGKVAASRNGQRSSAHPSCQCLTSDANEARTPHLHGTPETRGHHRHPTPREREPGDAPPRAAGAAPTPCPQCWDTPSRQMSCPTGQWLWQHSASSSAERDCFPPARGAPPPLPPRHLAQPRAAGTRRGYRSGCRYRPGSPAAATGHRALRDEPSRKRGRAAAGTARGWLREAAARVGRGGVSAAPRGTGAPSLSRPRAPPGCAAPRGTW